MRPSHAEVTTAVGLGPRPCTPCRIAVRGALAGRVDGHHLAPRRDHGERRGVGQLDGRGDATAGDLRIDAAAWFDTVLGVEGDLVGPGSAYGIARRECEYRRP